MLNIKSLLVTGVSLLLFSAGANAQNNKSIDSQDSWNEYLKNAQDDYDKFFKTSEKNYEDFRKKANEEYAEMLKKAWEGYKALNPISNPEDDVKPIVPPVIDDKPVKPIKDNPITVIPVAPIVTPPQPKPITPIVPQPIEDAKAVELHYGGLTFKMHPGTEPTSCPISEAAVSDCWNELSKGNWDTFIAECLEIREKHSLCDWAYLMMLQSFCHELSGVPADDKSCEDTLLIAYLYCQSGYKMRLGFDGTVLRMLYASHHIIYNQNYYKFGNYNFYTLGNSPTSHLRISNISFPNEQPLSLAITSPQKLGENYSTPRELKSYKYKDVSGTVKVNKNIIDFYNSYPTSSIGNNHVSRWALYAETPIAPEVRETLYPSLQKAIAQLTPLEAVNRLLNFVQTSLTYGYDDEVWGKDRALFPEETLYYPSCDCEDHAILFTRLVKDLVGLDVIMIYHPGHVYTAVAFDEPVTGDYIMYDNRRFMVCDPTIKGAGSPVGTTMKGMDNSKATAILVKR